MNKNIQKPNCGYRAKKKIKLKLIIAICIIWLIISVSAVSFFISYTMKNNDAYKAAVSYIESNEEIISIVGDIEKYGFFMYGGISVSGSGYANANLLIRVIGADANLRVAVWLERSPGVNWEIIDSAIVD